MNKSNKKNFDGRTFLIVFFAVFYPSLIAVAILGAPLTPSAVTKADTAAAEVEAQGEIPLRIKISSVGIDASIGNPESANVGVLDAALAKGAVRYPDSGLPGDGQNVFLFGHSSFLPQVNNVAYRTFNRLEKAKIGDLIEIDSETTTFRYAVSSITKAEAEAALVDLGNDNKLILSTCNSFGSKEERFIVIADFVDSHPLGS